MRNQLFQTRFKSKFWFKIQCFLNLSYVRNITKGISNCSGLFNNFNIRNRLIQRITK